MCKQHKYTYKYLCLNNMNMYMTVVFKLCAQHRHSNNTNRRMTFMSIPYKPMKSKFYTIIITKLWAMKFVM